MPGLILFRRRWAVASDDFVYPALLFAAFDVIWFFALFAVLLIVKKDDDWSGQTVFALNILFEAGFLLQALFNSALAAVSSKGTISDEHPRRSVPILLYCHIALLFANITITLASILWLSFYYARPLSDSQSIFAKALLAVVVWHMCSFAFILSGTWGFFDSGGRTWLRLKKFEDSVQRGQRVYKRSASRKRTWRSSMLSSTLHEVRLLRLQVFRRSSQFCVKCSLACGTEYLQSQRKVILQYQNSWRRRLRLMTGCARGTPDAQDALAEVAKLFTDFFYELDVVPSDLLAGLALLRRKQKKHVRPPILEACCSAYENVTGTPIAPKAALINFENEASINELNSVRYFMQYALAAYGWPFYLTNNATGTLWRLVRGLRVCSCLCCSSAMTAMPVVHSDNCFSCHSAAVALTLPVSHVRLIYACWRSHINQTPFYVAIDYREKAVILCVRGTLSMNDFVTDFNAQPQDIPLIDPQPCSAYQAHKGVISAAMYVMERLKKDSVLETAFSEAGPGCKLVIIGHSLGGGAATILAMILKPLYPELHCYVFAPPGGLLSRQAVELCRDYVTTLIVGKDLVARLGLLQLATIRNEIMQMLTTCKEPKVISANFCSENSFQWRIIGDAVLCCASSEAQNKEMTETVHLDSATLDREQAKAAGRKSLSNFPIMLPPGNIIHIFRSWPKEGKKGKPTFVAARVDNASFDEILVSTTMVHDHMPEGIIEALEGLLEQIDQSKSVLKIDTKPTETSSPCAAETSNVASDAKSAGVEPTVLQLRFCDSDCVEELV